MSTVTYEKALTFSGICDASGAVIVDEAHFIVANDEDNVLRVYDFNRGGEAISQIDISDYFQGDRDEEADIEAAAEINGTIYWITSHGRNKNRKLKPKRRNLFANRIKSSQDQITVKQVGQSYSRLLEAMLNEETLTHYRLNEAETLAPKEAGGLNIEGLCATPDGELWIGFRNPIRNHKALLLPLKNPKALVDDSDVSPRFGNPIDLGLNNLGIRSIEYWKKREMYLIAAGAYDGKQEFALYSWSGHSEEHPQELEMLGFPTDFKPEAIVIHPQYEDRFLLLSDDGSIKRADGKKCKKSAYQFFRGAWITFQA